MPYISKCCGAGVIRLETFNSNVGFSICKECADRCELVMTGESTRPFTLQERIDALVRDYTDIPTGEELRTRIEEIVKEAKAVAWEQALDDHRSWPEKDTTSSPC